MAQAARPYIPEPVLRQAIRQELREMRLDRPAPVREASQGRMPERPQTLEPVDDGGFYNDPWDDGFGDEGGTQAVAPLEPAPGGAIVIQSSAPVAPLQAGPTQTAIVVSDGYGPLAQMSRHLRIQAEAGYRAGVIRLKNGMFLVAEIAQEALEPEFGLVEVLAPLVFNAASKALENPETQRAILDATTHGAQAVGKGFQQLTQNRPHRPQHRPQNQHRPQASQRPRPAARPAAAPMAAPMPAPYYGPWPQFYPMMPPGYAMVPQPGMQMAQQQQAPAQAFQRTQLALRQEALPWADEEDFAGLLDESANGYAW